MKRSVLLFSLLFLLVLGSQAGEPKDSIQWYISGHPGVTIGFNGPYEVSKVDQADENKKEIVYGKGLDYNYALTIIQPKKDQKLAEEATQVFKNEIAYQLEYFEKLNGEALQLDMKTWESKGTKGFATFFDLKDYRYFYRVVVLDNTMYLISVAAPVADKDDPAIKQFMDSFGLVKAIDPEE